MKVQILDPSRFLVLLSREETQSLGLGACPWPSLHGRLTAARIFWEISRRYGISLGGRKILLRASAVISGESVLLFTLSSRGRGHFLPKSPHRIAVFRFSEAEALFSAAALLRRFPHGNTALYHWPVQNGSEWRMIAEIPFSQFPAFRRSMEEYGRFTGGGLCAAQTREHGRFLCDAPETRLLRSV